MTPNPRLNIPIMAIDPSLRATGVALGTADTNLERTYLTVDSVHLIETEKTSTKTVRMNSDDLRCARHIVDELARLRAEHQPIITIVEVPSGTQSARASWTLGIMLGVIATLPHPVIEVSPTVVKKSYAGSKTASKETMIRLATTAYPNLGWLRHGDRLTLKNEHLADAVAIMHTGVRTVAFRELTRMLQLPAAHEAAPGGEAHEHHVRRPA